ncbi:hypothetical protein GDO81_012069 [Engystomops pustulosus]|uniref:Uncharacterized protein n=1 Tax=Engystomops pustulosus TaxID=76066 RepID=A0AAV7BJE5_ENGPU|nr:hypothetical protein GDO81_012069 [Engystomops pustulosus]
MKRLVYKSQPVQGLNYNMAGQNIHFNGLMYFSQILVVSLKTCFQLGLSHRNEWNMKNADATGMSHKCHA